MPSPTNSTRLRALPREAPRSEAAAAPDRNHHAEVSPCGRATAGTSIATLGAAAAGECGGEVGALAQVASSRAVAEAIKLRDWDIGVGALGEATFSSTLVTVAIGARGDLRPASRSHDLPGCVATGASIPEVEREIREAIVFHLDGLRQDGLPVPRSVSVVD
jgi:hypothetical protein